MHYVASTVVYLAGRGTAAAACIFVAVVIMGMTYYLVDRRGINSNPEKAMAQCAKTKTQNIDDCF